MESQRFLHPVYREFYKERDVVMEEHRMRVESSPQGKLFQTFTATAFMAHPYRNPPGGWPSDIANLRRGEAEAFFAKYYVPSNMVMTIVGDVDPAEAKRLAEQYFGPMKAHPQPPMIHTTEPAQDGPKQAEVISASQPLAILGYKRPDQYDKDDPVFDVIQLILSSGRTGLMDKELVQDKKVALAAEAASTYPGGKYANLFVFFLAPSLGHTTEENIKAFDELLARFESRPPDAEQLARAKTQVRASLIRRLANNAGLAELLASAYIDYGDWRKLFTQIDDLNKVTAADVQRVAARYFTPSNRTLAFLVPGEARRRQGGRSETHFRSSRAAGGAPAGPDHRAAAAGARRLQSRGCPGAGRAFLQGSEVPRFAPGPDSQGGDFYPSERHEGLSAGGPRAAHR